MITLGSLATSVVNPETRFRPTLSGTLCTFAYLSRPTVAVVTN
jgi:hypothetical protein